jgi:hypothetical protein
MPGVSQNHFAYFFRTGAQADITLPTGIMIEEIAAIN